jgi:hypothetical protein
LISSRLVWSSSVRNDKIEDIDTVGAGAKSLSDLHYRIVGEQPTLEQQ